MDNWLSVSYTFTILFGTVALLGLTIYIIMYDFFLPYMRKYMYQKEEQRMRRKKEMVGIAPHILETVSRSYMASVYRGIVAPTGSIKLSHRELRKLIRTLQSFATQYNISINMLCETIEMLDGKTHFTIKQVAELLSLGVSRHSLVSKARKGYTYQEILESQYIPEDWSDNIYLNDKHIRYYFMN